MPLLMQRIFQLKQKNGNLIKIDDWRGRTEKKTEKQMASYDEDHYLIKEEVLPSGEKKFIIKNKKTGSIESR